MDLYWVLLNNYFESYYLVRLRRPGLTLLSGSRACSCGNRGARDRFGRPATA